MTRIEPPTCDHCYMLAFQHFKVLADTIKHYGCCFTPYGTLISVDPKGPIPIPLSPPSKFNLHG